jgi:hypothetical protein
VSHATDAMQASPDQQEPPDSREPQASLETPASLVSLVRTVATSYCMQDGLTETSKTFCMGASFL